jgi:hypothetical protein
VSVVLIKVSVGMEGLEQLVLLMATHASFTPSWATPSGAAVAESSAAVEAVQDAGAKVEVTMVVAVVGSMVTASGGMVAGAAIAVAKAAGATPFRRMAEPKRRTAPAIVMHRSGRTVLAIVQVVVRDTLKSERMDVAVER